MNIGKKSIEKSLCIISNFHTNWQLKNLNLEGDQRTGPKRRKENQLLSLERPNTTHF